MAYPLYFLCIMIVLSTGTVSQAGSMGPELKAVLQSSGSADEIDVIVTFADKVRVRNFKDPDRSRRRAALIKALRDKSRQSRLPAVRFLTGKKSKRFEPLWIINGLAASVKAEEIPELAGQPGVDHLILDRRVTLASTPASCNFSPTGWNLDAIRAPEMWASGFDGASVVVAAMDSGVDPNHPDLADRWRGGANSWFDPHGEHPDVPYDATGHGTQVMGLIVGGAAGGLPIGVAPGAQWIAAKIFDDNDETQLSDIHAGFQWLLDPDNDTETDDAPDIVNNSWVLEGTVDQCDLEFSEDIAALKAAEIAVVFAAGNSGPEPGTSMSPANDPQSLAVGAVAESFGTFAVTAASSRGPSSCGGGLYPTITAPGANVATSDRTLGGVFPDSYICVSGTSAAAPHVSGGLALLLDAINRQGRTTTVSLLESALGETSLDLGDPGPDNDYGAGLLDVKEAYNWLRANVEPPLFWGDVDNDGQVDLRDAVICLRLLSLQPVQSTINKWNAVSGTQHIGLSDVIYVLQQVSQ